MTPMTLALVREVWAGPVTDTGHPGAGGVHGTNDFKKEGILAGLTLQVNLGKAGLFLKERFKE